MPELKVWIASADSVRQGGVLGWCLVLLLLPFPLALTSTRLHLVHPLVRTLKRAIEEWCPNLG